MQTVKCHTELAQHKTSQVKQMHTIDIQSIQNIMYLYNSNHAFYDASN